jgi:NAD(P)-dependent dehydrogenase (short-subunit alcohol dehydrogenase family)
MQVVQAVQAAEAAHGPVDVLICCAGAAELGEC